MRTKKPFPFHNTIPYLYAALKTFSLLSQRQHTKLGFRYLHHIWHSDHFGATFWGKSVI